MNYNLIMKLLSFFKFDNSYRASKISLLLSILVGLVSYILIIAYRVAYPDTIIEGLTYYINATWAIEGCGRWFLPIINIISGNIIMPLFVILFYISAMWLSSILIAKTWNITKTSIIVIIAVAMTVTPATISQLVATYMGICFATAGLLSSLFVYLCFNEKHIISWLLAICCVVLMLASYQSYVSYIACLTIMTVYIKLENNHNRETAISFVKVLACGIIGCILYMISNKVILAVFNLESTTRLASFSFIDIFANLPSKIIEMYKTYFNYYNDYIMQRRIMYIVLFTLLIFYIVNNLFNKNISIFNKSIKLLCILLIPLSSNLIGIITPNNPITVLMTYQNILVIPFTLYLISTLNIKILTTITIFISTLICWTHVVSANATYQSYKLSYDYVNNQYSQVIYDIEHYDGYKLNETPVIIAGYFEDTVLRENIRTYGYAVGLFDDLVFWKDDAISTTFNRHRYILNYFGLDFIDFDYKEYAKIIDTDEFKQMPIWPKSEGIKIINGYLVVKIGNNYYK